MTVTHHVSDRGQMALPADVRRRWNIEDGGPVEIIDLGTGLLVVPGGRKAAIGLLAGAVADAGGYALLAKAVADEEPDLA